MVENSQIKRNIKSIYLQVGTNDLDQSSVDDVTFKISDAIDKLRNKFKGTKIVVSTLLPRRDNKMDDVNKVNEYLYNLCDGLKNVKLMENIAITQNMLVDTKHLNDVGFKLLLANIRYNLFGKLPRFRARNLNTPGRNTQRNNQINRRHAYRRVNRWDRFNNNS